MNLLITEMLDSTDNEPRTITFQATVIEINNDTILVKPVDGSLELDSSDQFILSRTITITRIGKEKSYNLTEEEVNIITDIIEKGVWSTEGTADCANDCKLIIGERTYDYHSECGTFNDNLNNQNLSVAAKEKESINAILAHYIMLGPG